jgi:hypothetical protein
VVLQEEFLSLSAKVAQASSPRFFTEARVNVRR